MWYFKSGTFGEEPESYTNGVWIHANTRCKAPIYTVDAPLEL